MMVKQDTPAEIVCVVRKSWRIRRKDAAHPYQWLLPKLQTKRRTPGLGVICMQACVRWMGGEEVHQSNRGDPSSVKKMINDKGGFGERWMVAALALTKVRS